MYVEHHDPPPTTYHHDPPPTTYQPTTSQPPSNRHPTATPPPPHRRPTTHRPQVPMVGWQIDPFGHSATQASTLSYAAGFDALYFGRIDYRDRAQRIATAECEGVWRASPSMGEHAQVFWGLTGSYDGNYGAPRGFDFELGHEKFGPPVIGAQPY